MKLGKLLRKESTCDYNNTNLQIDLPQWLDEILSRNMPQDVKGVCFNLYDDGNHKWSLEIIGTECFDKDNPDWACEEITDLGTRKKPFMWEEYNTWEEVLKKTAFVIDLYLKENESAKILKGKDGIGVGFVNGDIKVIYTNH